MTDSLPAWFQLCELETFHFETAISGTYIKYLGGMDSQFEISMDIISRYNEALAQKKY